jgi:hypoxanthine phosphoribosyltransferase
MEDAERIVIDDMNFRILLTRQQIQQRVEELGKEISQAYGNLNPIFIGVLNGAFIFLADLMRAVSIPCEMDFIKLSSYGDEQTSSGEVKMIKDYDALVHDRHVIIVEDIVDSGLSISFLREKFRLQNTASIRFCTLLLKPESAQVDFPLDFVGFRIPPEFVVGYGLDHRQKYRNLGSIYILDQEVSS